MPCWGPKSAATRSPSLLGLLIASRSGELCSTDLIAGGLGNPPRVPYLTAAASFLTSALLQTFTEAFTLTEKPFPGM